jgi:hypothetical protein
MIKMLRTTHFEKLAAATDATNPGSYYMTAAMDATNPGSCYTTTAIEARQSWKLLQQMPLVLLLCDCCNTC